MLSQLRLYNLLIALRVSIPFPFRGARSNIFISCKIPPISDDYLRAIVEQ